MSRESSPRHCPPAPDPDPAPPVDAVPATASESTSARSHDRSTDDLRIRALWSSAVGVAALLLLGVLWVEWRRVSPPALPDTLYRVPVNRADRATLQLLPNVGPTLADRIAARRRAVGPFRDVSDLRAVKGIGEKTARRISPHVTFAVESAPSRDPLGYASPD